MCVSAGWLTVTWGAGGGWRGDYHSPGRKTVRWGGEEERGERIRKEGREESLLRWAITKVKHFSTPFIFHSLFNAAISPKHAAISTKYFNINTRDDKSKNRC